MTDVHDAEERTAGDESGDDAMQGEIDPGTLTPDQQTALTLMQEICAATGQDLQPVTRDIQGAYMHVDLVGSDARGTWGRLGASLDALQMLANMILSRQVRTDVRLMLDADNYRERRTETLRGIALEYAREVKERNQEAEMDPLPAHERRIIHSTLVDDPDISTYSEGDEPNRRIVIAPRAK